MSDIGLTRSALPGAVPSLTQTSPGLCGPSHPRRRSSSCRAAAFGSAASAPSRYAAVRGPNQVVSASESPRWVRSPTQATCPSARISTAAGAVTAPSTGSSQIPAYLASVNWTRSAHGVMSKPPCSPRLSSTGRASRSRGQACPAQRGPARPGPARPEISTPRPATWKGEHGDQAIPYPRDQRFP